MTAATAAKRPEITIVRNEQVDKADKLEALLDQKKIAYREESPEQVLAPPAEGRPSDVVMVIAPIYEEKETLTLCSRIRDSERWQDAALLVAVNMYQMPLANRVKEMPHSDFIFMPPEGDQVLSKLQALTGAPLAEDSDATRPAP